MERGDILLKKKVSMCGGAIKIWKKSRSIVLNPLG